MGKQHPLSETLDRVIDYFVLQNNFDLYLNDHEILTTRESFDETGIGPENTVRDKSRTYYVDEDNLLHGHMTSIRKKVLETYGKDAAVIFPGRTYRVVKENYTHNSISHQVEAVVTKEPINLDVVVRLLQGLYWFLFQEESTYSSDFTVFTSPTVQFYFPCWVCEGKGCSNCYHRGELTWASGGISKGINGERILSFSIALDRLAMKRWNIKDCRTMYSRGTK